MMEKIPRPGSAFSQEKQPRENQKSEKEMESAKREVREAVHSGDVQSALSTYLRLREFLPTSFRGEKYDYSGSFAKEIMQKAILDAGAKAANSGDIKSMVEVYLSLRPYFPTNDRGQEYDYSGSFAKDVMRKAVRAAEKGGPDDIELAKKALDALRPYLPAESRDGRKFNYADSYERDINRL